MVQNGKTNSATFFLRKITFHVHVRLKGASRIMMMMVIKDDDDKNDDDDDDDDNNCGLDLTRVVGTPRWD